MLDMFRKNKKSIFGIVIIGFCALLMVPFGVDMIRTQDSSQLAITVGDREISTNEYYRRLQSWQNMFRAQFGDNFASVQKMLNLEQRTVDDLIQGILIENLSEALGLVASVSQVEQKIASHPFFQSGLTKDSYQQFLNAQGLTGVALQQLTSREIVAEQLANILSDLATPTQLELSSVFRDKNRKMSFRSIALDPSKLQDQVDISDQNLLEEFYNGQSENFKQPRAVGFSAVAFTAGEYEAKVELLEEDLQGLYEQQEHTLFEPKQVKLRRILFKKPAEDKSQLEQVLGEDNSKSDAEKQSVISGAELAKSKAEAIVKRLESGEVFAELAMETSEDDNTKISGGDLGWVRYSVLKGAVRRDASLLEKGEHSGVLDTEQGFEIIFVEDKRERRKKEFDEVRVDLERQLRQDIAPEYSRAAAEEFLLGVNQQKGSLTEYAQSQGKTFTSTPNLLKRGDTAPGIPSELIAKSATLVEGDREVFVVGNSSYVIEITEVKDAYIPEFPEVKDQVIAQYQREEAVKLAKAKSEELLLKLQALTKEEVSPDLLVEKMQQIAKESGAEVKTTELATRTTATGPMFSSPEIRRAAYALSNQNSITTEVMEAGGIYYLLQLAAVEDPQIPVSAEDFSSLEKEEMQNAGRRLNSALLETLKSRFEVWVNPEVYADRS